MNRMESSRARVSRAQMSTVSGHDSSLFGHICVFYRPKSSKYSQEQLACLNTFLSCGSPYVFSLKSFNEEWTRFDIHILIRMFFAWYNIYNIYIRKTVFLQAFQEWGEGVRSFPSAGNTRGPQTVWICW